MQSILVAILFTLTAQASQPTLMDDSRACEHAGAYADCFTLRLKDQMPAYLAPFDLAGITDVAAVRYDRGAAIQGGRLRSWGTSLFQPPKLTPRLGIFAAGHSGYFVGIQNGKIWSFRGDGARERVLAFEGPIKVVSARRSGEVCALGAHGVGCWDKSYPSGPPRIPELVDPVDIFPGFVKLDTMAEFGDQLDSVCALDEGRLKCWEKTKTIESPLGDLDGITKIYKGAGPEFCAQTGDGKLYCSHGTAAERYLVDIDSVTDLQSLAWDGVGAITADGKIALWPGGWSDATSEKGKPAYLTGEPYVKWTSPKLIPNRSALCVQWIEGSACFRRYFEVTQPREVPVATTRADYYGDGCDLFESGKWRCKGYHDYYDPDDFPAALRVTFAETTLAVEEAAKLSFRRAGERYEIPLPPAPWRLVESRISATYCNIHSKCTWGEQSFVVDPRGVQVVYPWEPAKSFVNPLPPEFLAKFKQPRKLRVLERMSRILCLLEGEHLECVNRTHRKTVLALDGVVDFDGRYEYIAPHAPDEYSSNDSHLCAALKNAVRCYRIASGWDGKSESVTTLPPLDDVAVDAIAISNKMALLSTHEGYRAYYYPSSRLGELVGPELETRLRALGDLGRVLSKLARLATPYDSAYLRLAAERAETGDASTRLVAAAMLPYLESKYLAHWLGAAPRGIASRIASLSGAYMKDVPLDDTTAVTAVRLVTAAWRGREALFTDAEKSRLAEIARDLPIQDLATLRAAVKAHPDWVKLLVTLAARPIVGPKLVVSVRVLDWLAGGG